VGWEAVYIAGSSGEGETPAVIEKGKETEKGSVGQLCVNIG
jgi:hypothetical protein